MKSGSARSTLPYAGTGEILIPAQYGRDKPHSRLQASRKLFSAYEGEELITPQEIISGLGAELTPSIELYHAANRIRAEATLPFIEHIEAASAANDPDRVEEFNAVYFLFSLLAEWRETRAYRPIAKLLRCNPNFVNGLFHPEEIHKVLFRIMASVFDDDLNVILDVIRDRSADSLVRGEMFSALVIIGLHQPVYRASIKEALQEFPVAQFQERSVYLWSAWSACIGSLGFAELVPLVRHMFNSGMYNPDIYEFSDFEKQLAIGKVLNLLKPLEGEHDFVLWNDASEDFRHSDGLTRNTGVPNPSKGSTPSLRKPKSSTTPSRNDPCFCGSGKKYKNCCMRKAS